MKHALFGTDGIRATVGSFPLTASDVPRLGHAIAQWIQKKYGNAATILLTHDTRVSCYWIKATLKGSLLQYPITIYDTSILPTPAAYKLTTLLHDFNCAIVISASHNPHHDNGIKILDAKSGKLSMQDERLIEQLFHENNHKQIDYTKTGNVHRLSSAQKQYADVIIDLFPSGFLQRKKVVLDCAHGATYQIAAKIFSRLGVQALVINNRPNGININDQCGPLHPARLQEAVVKHGADIGFAFDGDGDRVIAVNKLGHIKDGDDLLALLINHPNYMQQKTIVGTIMSNQGLAVFLEKKNKKLLRTPVGDKHITERLIKENLLLGGEQSGHIILREYLNIGDGIFTALCVLETVELTNNWDMITFQKYPQTLINIPITIRKELNHPPLAAIITAHQQQLDSGRIIVRYSGTELMLRIMIEDRDKKLVDHVGAHLARALQQKLE